MISGRFEPIEAVRDRDVAVPCLTMNHHRLGSIDSPAFPGVDSSTERVLSVGGPCLSRIFHDAAPTPALMRALAEAVRRAEADPRAVEHPELVDPDAYWTQAAWPRARAAVKQARAVLIECVEEVAVAVGNAPHALEAWLRAHLASTPDARRADPAAARDAAIDGLIERCQELHRAVERLGLLRDAIEPVAATRADIDTARRRRAEDEVRRSREEVEHAHADLGRDEFNAWWTATFDARVAARDAALRADPPYRHQELALAAHEQARAAIDHDITAMIAQLTAPILGFGQAMVARYDEFAVLADESAAAVFDRDGVTRAAE